MQRNGIPIATRASMLLVQVSLCAALASAQDDPVPFNLPEARMAVVCVRRIDPLTAPVHGTGFLTSPEGHVYTNRHVVQSPGPEPEGRMLFVGVPSRADPDDLEYFRAEVSFVPPEGDALDFAILKIVARPEYGTFASLPMSLEKLDLGSPVAAIGYPTISENLPVLSFNRGSISSTRVRFEGRSYYQTDAAINPGNSGGPLLNLAGQVVGIVTFKKIAADNMGYALYLRDTVEAAEAARARAATLSLTPGPIQVPTILNPKGIPPRAAHWATTSARIQEERDRLLLDNEGGQYWVTSKFPLPERFRISIPCQIEYLEGSRTAFGGHRSLCVRFGTDATDAKILIPHGIHIRFSHDQLVLSIDQSPLKMVRRGNTPKPFVLTITRTEALIAIAVDEDLVLEHRGEQIAGDLPGGRHPLSIGGYLSRLSLGPVSIVDLGSTRVPGVPETP